MTGVQTCALPISVNVIGADDAPTLAAVTSGSITEVDQSSTTIDSGLSGTLVGADVDVEDLTYGIQGGTVVGTTVTSVGDFGVLTLDTVTGIYSFAKDASAIEALDDTEIDSDVFTMTVSDGDGALVTKTYTVNVIGADDTPVAVDDIGAVNDDATLTVLKADGVIDNNDYDMDGDTLTVTGIRTGPEAGIGIVGTVGLALIGTYGTLTLEADGSYTYVADQRSEERRVGKGCRKWCRSRRSQKHTKKKKRK